MRDLYQLDLKASGLTEFWQQHVPDGLIQIGDLKLCLDAVDLLPQCSRPIPNAGGWRVH